MRRKPISPSLFYVLHKTWNLAFSCPGRAVMAKKILKKAWCTCRVVALPIYFNLLPFWRSLCRRRCGILKSLMMIFLCCFFWLTINKPSPTSNQGEPLFKGHLLWSWECPLNRGLIVFVLSIASSLFFFYFKAHLITFCALYCEPVDFLDRDFYDNLW